MATQINADFLNANQLKYRRSSASISMKGILYIVGTPIGNLEDVTLRALRILKEVDVILCEDTRVTRKLLERHEIKKPLLSYHQHSRLSRINEILGMLQRGKSLALVSDAGTPGISDPGNELIGKAIEQLGNIVIVPVPGPSAVTAIASIAGISTQRFCFFGYPPYKKGRKKFFSGIAASSMPVILYESPHRILRTLNDLLLAIGDKRYTIVGRELTKKFETIYRGPLREIAEIVGKEKPRGEYAVILAPK